MKVRDVIRILVREGWHLDRQVGSHRQFRHAEKPGTVTVPGKPGDELAPGTLGSIRRQAGLWEAPMRYAIVIEKASTNYSAYSPDLPGCVTTGDTIEETRRNMAEAIRVHLENIALHGEAIPQPQSVVDYVDAPLASPTLP